MPIWRMRMIATFIGTKLLLLGGLGEVMQELTSIDIYDVHTGEDFSRRRLIRVPVYI